MQELKRLRTVEYSGIETTQDSGVYSGIETTQDSAWSIRWQY